MQVQTEVSVTYVLTLTESEANWLSNIMQNPLHGEDPRKEDREQAKYRRAFWEALNPIQADRPSKEV